MTTSSWFVVGVGGVTNGGKSTLSQKLQSLYPGSKYLCMDDSFRSQDDPNHRKAPGLNHFNWDGLWAIDIEGWKAKITSILELDMESVLNTSDVIPHVSVAPEGLHPTGPIPKLNCNLLILDGFVAMNEPWTASLSHIKFLFTMDKALCFQRRKTRTYEPPDIPGYFEACVWPEYEKSRDEALLKNPDIVQVDGSRSFQENLDFMLQHIARSAHKFGKLEEEGGLIHK